MHTDEENEQALYSVMAPKKSQNKTNEIAGMG
jgi:hypothetical protein